ncbi:MAG TPA: fatty acid desaturase, partial [Bacteroidia bacterium]|nr:fatty acid desaturase [Bacteroidia bacterium]
MRELSKRVNAYFKDNNISQHANAAMVIKTVIVMLAWCATYALIMSNILSPHPLLLILAFTLLGYVNITIAFNIVHDSCHGAYSANPKVNKALGYFMNFTGGNSYLFTMMHDAHHSFVNIHGIDVTLETHGMFR